MALPVVQSAAFKRLRHATFLGILSPAFAIVEKHPLARANTGKDQSRAHHSFKVALLAARMTTAMGLPDQVVKYAMAWGLLHDIATWPLSHTGEAAFSESTGVSASDLRKFMIFGDSRLDDVWSVYLPIKSLRLDHGRLLELFRKSPGGLDSELAVLHKLLHSPLTPDTLEGMHRTGRVVGIDVPRPDTFADAMEQDLVSGVRLKEAYSRDALSFWRSKSAIYSRFINRAETIEFESNWSRSVCDLFVGLSLSETLALSEKEIVGKVLDRGLRKANGIIRYKSPLKYSISEPYRKKRILKKGIPVDELSGVLVKSSS
ncbi:HD domain-containing protein [Aestuariivirga sp.]|uniref:HD domain-containing protein n=1 Tax=Aestuariivirga sp. TaxID=2650926 RepID=UPI0039E68634